MSYSFSNILIKMSTTNTRWNIHYAEQKTDYTLKTNTESPQEIGYDLQPGHIYAFRFLYFFY